MFWWKFCLVSRRPPLPEIGCTSIHTKDRKTIYSPCAISKTFLTICCSFFFSLPSITLFSLSLISLSSLLVDHGSQWQFMVHKGASDLVSVAVNQSGSRWLGSVGGPIQLGFWVCQQWLVNNGRGWCLVCSKHRDHFKTE